jgi:CRP-like cAMP-binding protein
MIFIEFGICEIYIEFEGNVFVLERLIQGNIINSRSFFFEDTMQVNIRAIGQVNLLKISTYKFQDLCETNQDLGNNVLRYQ